MIAPCLRLYLIPQPLWESIFEDGSSLLALAAEALRTEQRLIKNVVPARELRRYFQLCSRLESLTGTLSKQTETWCDIPPSEGASYFEAIIKGESTGAFAQSSRWGTSFFPPGQCTRNHLAALESLESEALSRRLGLFRRAVQDNAGVVEIIGSPAYSHPEDFESPLTVPLQREMTWMSNESTNLKDQIAKAIKEGTPINFSNYRHREITETLHAHVFAPHDPTKVRVIFADGSEASSFPMPFLPLPSGNAPTEPLLSLSLVSGRHPELDRDTDLAVLRNAEITSSQTMAEQEALASYRALNVLRSPAFSQGGLINVYHTGLEPVVIGFYRSVVTILQERSQDVSPLILVPIYHRRGTVRIDSICPSLNRLVEAYSDAIRILKQPKAKAKDIWIRWMIDRPMTHPEQEDLINNFPDLAEDIARLYASSQYVVGSPWGAPK